MRETQIRVDLNTIGNNAKNIVSKYKEYEYYFGVLKSSAYGHGEYIVNEIVKNGINYIAVSVLSEALKIRKYNKDIPILILEPIDISDFETALKYDFTLTITDISYLKEILAFNKNIKLHIKLDTGMNRLGVKDKEEVKEAYDLIDNSKAMLEGIYTHFATIGLFDRYYDLQVKKLYELTSLIDLKTIPIRHVASSVIMLSHKKLDFVNGVRIGVLLYGYNTAPIIENNGLKDKLRNFRNSFYQRKYKISKLIYGAKVDVKPCMTMTTKILQIKDVKKGEAIGYGATFVAPGDMRIAVLPIGYNNGIGNNNYGRCVIINNKKYYVIGEIAMNMMIVEIDDNVDINDEVYILGSGISIGTLSRFDGNSIFKMLLDIGKNNKRVYTKDNKIVYEEETR